MTPPGRSSSSSSSNWSSQRNGSDLRSFFATPSSTASPTTNSGASSRKRRRTSTSNGGSAYGDCPLCEVTLPFHTLERHAATCNGKIAPKAIATTTTASSSSSVTTPTTTLKNNSTLIKSPKPTPTIVTLERDTDSTKHWNGTVDLNPSIMTGIPARQSPIITNTTSASASASIVIPESTPQQEAKNEAILTSISDTTPIIHLKDGDALTSTSSRHGRRSNSNINPYATIRSVQVKPIILPPPPPPKSITSSEVKSQDMPQQVRLLPGLHLYENFITEEEERQILATLDDPTHCHNEYVPWKASHFNGSHFGKRWGVHCNLRTRQVTQPPCHDEAHSLPWFIDAIILPKLRALHLNLNLNLNLPHNNNNNTSNNTSNNNWNPNEANAIDYDRRKGHHLKHHVDDRQLSKEPIANISLAGDCYMTFRNDKRRTNPGGSNNHHHDNSSNNLLLAVPNERRILLKRRCLQVLTGKARYDYSHGIRNADLLSDRRVSLTMRESPLTTKTTTTTKAKATGAQRQRQLPSNQSTLHDAFRTKAANA